MNEKSLICLGIESTAHTFGIGIVTSEGQILADARDVYKTGQGQGIVPFDAADHHRGIKEQVLEDALCKANRGWRDIDLIAVSQGAGLPPCLQVGCAFATLLARGQNKPLVPVCHQIGHIEIARLFARMRDPVVLYVSGGNSQVISFINGRYVVLGEAMDIGIGNALDKFGRRVGLDFPAGPKIEELAKKGQYVELPYVVKGMDLSFSGIVTEALRKYQQGESLENLCFSLQETSFAMLTEVTERALAHLGKDEVILTGGVAANQRLGDMLRIMCEERGAVFFSCPPQWSGDNGTMIAWTGLLAYQHGQTIVPEALVPRPTLRTDDAEIPWTR